MILPAFALSNAAVIVLWCCAPVLGLARFRAVGQSDRRIHAPQVFTLMAILVPLSASAILLILISGLAYLPEILPGMTLLIPAGLVAALQLELSRPDPPTRRNESLRLRGTLGLFAAGTGSRGGL